MSKQEELVIERLVNGSVRNLLRLCPNELILPAVVVQVRLKNYTTS